MTDCLICSSMLSLISEYAYQLKRLDEVIEYNEKRWLHVTLYDCHPTTCNNRHKELKDAENENWLISQRYIRVNKELTEHYRDHHLLRP